MSDFVFPVQQPSPKYVVWEIIFFIYERRREISIMSAIAIVISLFAFFFHEQPHDPCEPKQPRGFIETPIVSPVVITSTQVCPFGGVTFKTIPPEQWPGR